MSIKNAIVCRVSQWLYFDFKCDALFECYTAFPQTMLFLYTYYHQMDDYRASKMHSEKKMNRNKKKMPTNQRFNWIWLPDEREYNCKHCSLVNWQSITNFWPEHNLKWSHLCLCTKFNVFCSSHWITLLYDNKQIILLSLSCSFGLSPFHLNFINYSDNQVDYAHGPRIYGHTKARVRKS